MHDLLMAKQWLERARKDMLSAEHLLTNLHPMPAEVVCYLSSQAAEKSLKAVLAYHTLRIPKTHNFQELINNLALVTEVIFIEEKTADTMTIYALNTRYVDDSRDFTEDDAHFAVKQSAKIMELVDNYFSSKEATK